MRILDAHVHAFEHLHGFGWRGEFRAVGDGCGVWANGDSMRVIPEGMGETSFTAESLLKVLDENSVEKAVLLQGSLYGFANDYVSEVIKKYPQRLTGAGSYDPFCLDSKTILNRLTDTLGYKIIKLEFSSYGGFMGYHDDFKINIPMMDMLWRKARELSLVIVLDLGSPGSNSFQTAELESVVKAYPDITFVITHLGAPTTKDKTAYTEMVTMFAPYENINFDLSAMLWNTMPDSAPYPCATEYLQLAKDHLSHKRLLWGSDIPCVLTKYSYNALVDFVVNSQVFSQKELEDVFYNNAQAIYFV